jgi:two-component sensor histidine kinase
MTCLHCKAIRTTLQRVPPLGSSGLPRATSALVLPRSQAQAIEANDAFLDLSGYSREDLQAGRVRWNMMTPPEYRHLDAHAEAELKARGVCTPFEKEYPRPERAPAAGGTTARLAAGEGVLLKEMHHRVKNNLQVVANLFDMQADTIEDLSIRALFEDSQQRIQSIALIHESLYQSGDVVAYVRAADYLPRLSQQLIEAYRPPGDRHTLRIRAEPVWLAVPMAIPCGVLVTELVTNSFKHAFPDDLVGEIHVTLRQDPAGSCVLILGDTGVGLPEGLDVRATESPGWQLVYPAQGAAEGHDRTGGPRGDHGDDYLSPLRAWHEVWPSAGIFLVDSLIATTLRDGADQDRALPRLVV